MRSESMSFMAVLQEWYHFVGSRLFSLRIPVLERNNRIIYLLFQANTINSRDIEILCSYWFQSYIQIPKRCHQIMNHNPIGRVLHMNLPYQGVLETWMSGNRHQCRQKITEVIYHLAFLTFFTLLSSVFLTDWDQNLTLMLITCIILMLSVILIELILLCYYTGNKMPRNTKH